MARAEIQRDLLVAALGWRCGYVALDVQMPPVAAEEDGTPLEVDLVFHSSGLAEGTLRATVTLTPNQPAGCIVSGKLTQPVPDQLILWTLVFHNNRHSGSCRQVLCPPPDQPARAPSAAPAYTGRATTAGE